MPKTAKQRRLIALVLLAWNALGVVIWGFQAASNPETLADGDKVRMEVWQAMPLWAWAAYAVATWSGLLGSVALLKERRAAIWLYAISTLAIFVQFSYALVLSPLPAAKGPAVVAFPAVIFMIALGSMAYAHSAAKRDWLG